MAAKKGSLSINSENMLPIIKKWLYSDHDIFIREQVANACDAITKLKKLEGVGEYTPEEGKKYEIRVIVDPDEKTLKFIDNGIGMTEDEVVEYITQIAFSGASKFLEKYKGKTDKDQIIGHFGLGFYSAYMVADEVQIDTLSYQKDAKPVHWQSDGTSEYTIEDGDRKEVGTEITLYLNDSCYEFCNEFRVREVLNKYCSFMPYPIYLSDSGKAAKKREEDAEKKLEEDNRKAADEAIKKGEKVPEPKKKEEPQPVNDIHPLWTRPAKDCTDDDYRTFYRKVFNDYKEPLFWIHLNMDYPFSLRGILYFPKINTEYDALDAEIKLYNNQVFIADNIKEVIPEYLMTLKGVIDCPDLPLNVSRSALQNDGSVKKISEYISKKVADKLSGMCKTDREEYEKYWDDISPFIKYGCIKDTKFADKMMEFILFKDLDGKYLTLKEYKEKNQIPDEEEKKESGKEAAEQKDTAEAEKKDAAEADRKADAEGEKKADAEKKDTTEAEEKDAAEADQKADAEDEKKEPEKSTVYYVSDEVQQAQYISMFRNRKKDAVILKQNIDSPFITQLEQRNQNLRFARIDSELDEAFKGKKAVAKEDQDSLTEIFRKNLEKDKLKIEVENMKDKDVAAIMTLSEDSRRMQDMMKMYGMQGANDPSMFGGEETLILNAEHPLVKFVLEHRKSQSVPVICKQLYDLAMISHKPLSQKEMEEFVRRSNEIMMLLTK
ncbi:MAG: molecular chaperone HtpG [Lachnospiraceae bacterium]|jgi:molecular chaperone HtpG|nr:molecular chaperone HtpG [Lachnospiraceae bacterium]